MYRVEAATPSSIPVSSMTARSSAARRALEPRMAESQKAPKPSVQDDVTDDLARDHTFGGSGSMPMMRSPPALLGSVAPMTPRSCLGQQPRRSHSTSS